MEINNFNSLHIYSGIHHPWETMGCIPPPVYTSLFARGKYCHRPTGNLKIQDILMR